MDSTWRGIGMVEIWTPDGTVYMERTDAVKYILDKMEKNEVAIYKGVVDDDRLEDDSN